MNIVIDGRTLTGEIMGIANFFKLAIESMSKVGGGNIKIYILIPKPLHHSLSTIFPPNVQIIECPLLFMKFLPRLVWFLVMMPIMLRRLNADVYYSPTPSIPLGIPSRIVKIITIHDVVSIEYAKTMKLNNRISSFLIFNRSVKQADLIWANSYYTKGKIEDYFPERKCKTIFVGCSIDTAVFKKREVDSVESISVREKYGIRDKFILFVGSLEPRKNLSFLLGLMPELYLKTEIQLLIVGAKGWKNSGISNIVNEPSYPKTSTCFAGYVDVEELVLLYNIATCFVSTSLNEGFGMPQLEALFCGCPVISPHNSAMIEVVKDYGITIDGWDKTEWIRAITECANGKSSFVNIDNLLQKYNWETIIQRLFLLIEK
ncbi:MAG: hypothetical protein BGN96_09690 [Bacteroidales bacterium 45-6]|uniref:glycosyltransferase family 4 protein n=1 Tax=uncultured Dysgonomonas sp. TaxID=206096 RepID=UPI0009652715|nr:glycosyltransferase family 1 protein [uncultured Dysgonomonas sp.]OJU53252.1 MAG: hypothetical protein BGN96_09690 [Bacteroidales bacterium 45-6]